MIRSILLSPLCALALLPATALIAQDAPAAPAKVLKPGDPAPALACGDWVQGEAVKGFEKGKVYIVEFWATWCGPCKAAIPHVNELQKKYQDKGLVVIGQNCWERDEAKVKPFIAEMGEKMTYRVAMDDKSKAGAGAMAETWMKAAGKNGIPCSFVVGTEGKILWIGHPMQLKESMIEEMLANKFDAAAAGAAQAKEQAASNALRDKSMAVRKLVQEKKWDEAEKAVDELAAGLPEGQKSMPANMRLDIALGRGDAEAALKQAQAVLDSAPEQYRASMGSMVARRLVAADKPDPKLAKAALEMAASACEKAAGKDPVALLTLGEIQTKMDQKDEAAKSFEKALEVAPEQIKPQLQKRIDTLKGKPAEGAEK